MPEYSSAQGNVSQPPWNRGPMTSVDGPTYAPSGRSGGGIPTSFGNQTDMATAFEGALSDMRAVSQETLKVLGEVGIMAQRVSAMLGDTGDRSFAQPAGPNQVAQMFPSATSASVGAAITTSLALGYGFGGANMALPVGMSNVASQTFGQGFGPTASPVSVGDGGTGDAPSAPIGSNPMGDWTHATPEKKEEGNNALRLKSFLEGEAGEKFLSGQGGPQEYAAGKALGAHPSVSSIAQRLAQHVQTSRGWGSGGESTLEQLSRSQRNKIIRMGTVTSSYRPSEEAMQTLSDLRSGGTVAAEATGLRAGVGAIAGGEGLEAGLSAIAGGGVAGPIGIGVGLAAFGVHEMESQRAINAQIQSQIGGSNFSAFGTRAQGLGFGISQIGTMGMGMANQAFTGVTDIGLQGGKRADALNFVTQNYTNMGMSIADSLALVSTAVKSGTANLQQLASTLDAVTNSAAAAGVNTEQARQNFSQMYQSALSNGMTSTGASMLAGGSTILTNQLGLSGQGVKFGQASDAQAAAAMGLNLGEYQNRLSGPDGAQFAAAANQNVMSNGLGSLVSGISGIKGLAGTAFTKQAGVGSAFADRVRSATAGGVNDQNISQILATYGVDTKGVSLSGQWDALAGVISGHSNLNVGVTSAMAVSSVNDEIAKLRPKSGGFFGLGNQMTMSTHNHQLSGAEQNIDQYITKHGVNDKGSITAAALLAHGSQDRVSGAAFGQAGYGDETIQAALGDPKTFAALMAGKGTINVGGKKESISTFVAQHRADMAPPSKTGKNGKGSIGTVTVVMGQGLANILNLVGSGAVNIGNNSSTLNSPPTMDPVSFTGG